MAAVQRDGDDPDAAAGRIAQRRDRGGADPLRGDAPAPGATARARSGARPDGSVRDDEPPAARGEPDARRSVRAARRADAARAPSTTSSGRTRSSAPGRPLRAAIEHDRLRSIILWGPPGTGKTTLARVIASATRAHFIAFSAVHVGHQGDPRGHGGGRSRRGAARAAGRSCSSTRSTASTRRSRTPSCRASSRATSSSSARPPRTRRSR